MQYVKSTNVLVPEKNGDGFITIVYLINKRDKSASKM